MEQIDKLIKVLLDKKARGDEREDAAMDLSAFNDEKALSALLEIAENSEEKPFLHDACAESIAEIWMRKNVFSIEAYRRMQPFAKKVLSGFIKSHKPEWNRYLQID